MNKTEELIFNTYMSLIENYNLFYIKNISNNDNQRHFLKLEELTNSLNIMLFNKNFTIFNISQKTIQKMSKKIEHIKQLKKLSQKIKKWEDIIENLFIWAIKNTGARIIIRNIPQLTTSGISIDEDTIYDTLVNYFDTNDIQTVHHIGEGIFLIKTPTKQIAQSVIEMINNNLIEGNVIKAKLLEPLTHVDNDFNQGINGLTFMKHLAYSHYQYFMMNKDNSNTNNPYELGIYYMFSSYNECQNILSNSLYDVYRETVLDEEQKHNTKPISIICDILETISFIIPVAFFMYFVCNNS